MCYNVIDGRYHTACNHFIPMSTSFNDCGASNCLFSRNHVHAAACACQNSSCIRLMTQPVRNPIRISPSLCQDCTFGNREELKQHLRLEAPASAGPMRVA